MYIAQAKRKENIAEYILYLWQLEDLLRALQFSPEAIWNKLVLPQVSDDPHKQNDLLVWYMDICALLREEGKAQNGHLDHTLRLIADLHDLHTELLQAPAGEHYRTLYSALQSELVPLRAAAGKENISDIELAFRALYAVMLYRIKGDGSKENTNSEIIGLISPLIGELARIFHAVERGELDIWHRD